MDDLLTQITELTQAQRKKVLSWIASLPEEQVAEVIQGGVKISFQIKNENDDIPGRVCKLGAMILSARKAGWDTLNNNGYRVADKEQYDDFSHLRKSKAAEFSRRGRKPLLRKKILAYWGEVKELKEEGMGFAPIAAYLQKNRKVKTSASNLAKMWRELEVVQDD